MRATRRGVLKAASALGATSLFSTATPDLFRSGNALLTWAQTRANLQGTRTVAAFGGGSGPQQLGLRTAAGTMPDGANALAARRDGSVAVLDTLNRRIAIVRGSSITQLIPLANAIYPRDILESNGALYVLDAAGDQVLEISRTTVRSLPLPRESRRAASGLTIGSNGNRVAVVEEDAYSYGLDHGRGARVQSFPGGGTSRAQVTYGSKRLDRRNAAISLGSGGTANIETSGPLGSAVPVGFDDSGNAYVLVAELVNTPGRGIGVDLTVRRFAPDGTALGRARVPVRGRSTNPTRVVTIAPNGDAFALFTEETVTLVVALEWQATLAALPPVLRLPEVGVAAAVNDIPACRDATRNTAYYNYYDSQWYCAAANMSTSRPPGTNQCGGLFPTYITAPNYYYQYPYKWNGWANNAGFIASMNAGKQAGNYDAVIRDCTDGLDCSGFVQRCWGISDQKYNDWQLADWFCTNKADIDPGNPPPWMQVGDAYDLRGGHIRMHDIYASLETGVYVYECAAANGERVWNTFYGWNSQNSYEWCIGNFHC
jgi:hypothetical protein